MSKEFTAVDAAIGFDIIEQFGLITYGDNYAFCPQLGNVQPPDGIIIGATVAEVCLKTRAWLETQGWRSKYEGELNQMLGAMHAANQYE